MARKTIYLHIGQTKTATTTLQAFFHGHREWLARKGVFYPNSPEGHPVVRKHRFVLDAARAYVRREPGRGKPYWAHLKSEVVRSPASKVLLSEELLWHLYEEDPEKRGEAIAAVARELAGFDVKVICYLRRQDRWVESYHNQIVKTDVAERSRLGIRAFADKYRQLGYFDYAARLAEWADVFGEANLLIRPFERGQFAEGEIVVDFCGLLGIGSLDGVTMPSDRQVSLSNAACELSGCYNRAVGAEEFKKEFLEVIRDFDLERKDPRRYLPAKLAREIVAACESGNRQVAQRFLGREDGGLFLDKGIHDPELDYPGISVKDLTEAVMQIFVAQQGRIEALEARLGALEAARAAEPQAAAPRRAPKARRAGAE